MENSATIPLVVAVPLPPPLGLGLNSQSTIFTGFSRYSANLFASRKTWTLAIAVFFARTNSDSINITTHK